jgi:ribosomal-protein-alanine N-acetyltransferase
MTLHESCAAVLKTPPPVDWRRGLPELHAGDDRLRELRAADARSLYRHLYRPRVLRFMSPCPQSVDAFHTFIRWAHRERRRGALACFGIVPAHRPHPVGVVQIWRIERDFSTAEWGFAVDDRYWGGGLFLGAARVAVDFAFTHLGVYRLEARAVDMNVRGNRVLEKLGATREGVLRGGFRDGSLYRDHVMWSILAPEWQRSRGRTTHAA